MTWDALQILMVDDSPEDRLFYQRFLRKNSDASYHFLEADSSQEGLALCRSACPDCVILDYQLPDFNGVEFLKALSEDETTSAIPVIMLTGQGDRRLDLTVMKAGAVDYLVKDQVNAAQMERSIRYAVERKRAQEQLTYMARFDHLTGLANRLQLQTRLNQALIRAERTKRTAALLFLDLDRFKMINDTLGHHAGDQLLKAVAERLQGCARKVDTVARLGGDEFSIVLEEAGDIRDVAAFAQRVLDVMSAPFLLDEYRMFTTPSIGITVYPIDGETSGDLLKNADTAMYRAKREGGNTYQFYTFGMNAQASKRLAFEQHLHQALEREEFQLYYQPQVDLSTGNMLGMEALLRWNHPDQGLLVPGQFLSVIEEAGLMDRVGEWVLKTACHQAYEWQGLGFPPFRVSVNLAARQLQRIDFVDMVGQVLQDTGLAPECLELELTEGSLIENTQATKKTLSAIRSLGSHLSIDDFGTGYSSLSYLKRFPVSALKIDQSFVQDITTSDDDAAIVTAMITLAHSLRLKAVAEGVETEAQQAFLQDQGCDAMQGYFISHPLPACRFTEWWQANKSTADPTPLHLAA